jgi:phosphate transport system permease protein
MAGEPVGEEPVAHDYGGEDIGHLRGRMFEGLTFLSTVFGILMVTVLLGYVANDAFRPLSADPGWHLVFLVTLVLPSLGLLAYYLRRQPAAGRVAYETLGVPVVGLLVGGGLVVLFVEIVTPAEWFGLLLGLLVGAGAVYAHRRLRTEAALERLVVLLVAPLLAVVGVPALSVEFIAKTPLTGTDLFWISFATPALLPGIPDLVLASPVLPPGWVLLVAAVTVPLAAVLGRVVAARRDDDRGFEETVIASVVVVSLGALVVPATGVMNAENWVPLASATLIPTGVYVEGVIRRGEGTSGLAFPVVVVVGALVGLALVRTLGFAGPNPWLDWGFLTSATSRNPEDAGIYPALVGSVLMLVVIIVSAFPIGVGAAIYLEEYAPDTGYLGRVVDLIEINIGNLAGVPSVVYGLLGLAVFIRGVGFESGIVIVGGFTIGLLILPIVIISAQEAVRAVPDSMRRASYGMGATRWQTVRNVVLPEALPGALTGTILALGRAIGETAPLLMIGAAASVRLPPDGFFSKFSAMPRQIFAWSSEIQPEFRFGVLAAGVVTLLVVLLIMNGTAILLRNKYQTDTS